MPKPKGKTRTRKSGRNQAGAGGMNGERGMGRGGGNRLGPGGNCICPKCGATAPHQQGTPCTSMSCPSCGAVMTRKA